MKGESKNNKLVGLILPNRILYYTNIAIIAHSPDFIGQKILYRQMNENGLEQRLTVTFSFKYRKYPRHVRQHSPLYYYQRAHLPIKRGKFRPAKKPAGILRGKKSLPISPMTGTGKLLHQVSHKILLYRPILQLFQNFVTSLFLLGWRTVLPHVGEEHGIIRESQMSVHLREILPAGFLSIG